MGGGGECQGGPTKDRINRNPNHILVRLAVYFIPALYVASGEIFQLLAENKALVIERPKMNVTSVVTGLEVDGPRPKRIVA
ncbi:hypothetical protein CHU98_g8060 [Xylaria longipes]|nr:hypothetical protein CHU98_g8060 [Xylaria longipes]